MTDHKAMPVAGYSAQSNSNVELANEAKALEERYLRFLDKLAADPATDKRNVALARTLMEDAGMRTVRAIFQPKRINLPDDVNVVHP
jgi:hypothetical protein